jgi:hypothetical protein
MYAVDENLYQSLGRSVVGVVNNILLVVILLVVPPIGWIPLVVTIGWWEVKGKMIGLIQRSFVRTLKANNSEG